MSSSQSRRRTRASKPKYTFLVETENLHRTYIMGKVELHALRGVDLQVEPGEFVVILGVSGSGKSTLLHLLGGLDRPTEGRVIIEGEDRYDNTKLKVSDGKIIGYYETQRWKKDKNFCKTVLRKPRRKNG